MTTLTTAQATSLWTRGQAILEGTWWLTTRTTEYEWDSSLQRYVAITTGLRVRHRLGARWDGTRFRCCRCTHCQRHPAQAAEVDVA